MDTHDDCDRDLRDLFDDEHRQLPPDPFLKTAATRLGRSRARATLWKRALQAAGLAALIFGSPWLIAGSAVLSAELRDLFIKVSALLSTRVGAGVALLCVFALLIVWRRRLLS